MNVSKITTALRDPYRAYLHLVKKPFVYIDRHFNYGTNVFDRQWDLLIVVDACRYDLFAEFAPRHSVYELINGVEPMYSLASKSDDWLQRTFGQTDDTVLAETLYLSDESHAGMVRTDKLHHIATVHGEEDTTAGGVLRPEAITDAAIRSFRTSAAKKYIVHYFQPHAPFLVCPGKYDSVGNEPGSTQNVWNGLRDGKFDKDEIWQDYGENLLLVLDHVETLIRYFDGEVAITSDHGNAMGEFGLYGHPFSGAAPSIRRVPWATATGLGNDDREVLQ